MATLAEQVSREKESVFCVANLWQGALLSGGTSFLLQQELPPKHPQCRLFVTTAHTVEFLEHRMGRLATVNHQGVGFFVSLLDTQREEDLDLALLVFRGDCRALPEGLSLSPKELPAGTEVQQE